MGTAQVQEKRKHQRYSCALGVEIRVADAEAGYWGNLADICLGGCYVASFSPLPIGTSVVLVVKSKNLEINIAGKIVTSHPGVGMGIQFAGYNHPEGDVYLKALLEDLAQPQLADQHVP